jgi:amino acid permease
VGYIAAVIAILTMTSMALAGIMAASRYPFAMARDNLLPQDLENVNGRFETPHWSIIGTALAMGAAILFLPIADVAKLASGFQIMIFVVINSCVLVLRRASEAHAWYKPKFRSPFGPSVQILGIVGAIALLYLMGEKALIGAVACAVVGVCIYFSYGRAHAHPKLTPWRTVRMEFTDPDRAEHEKRWLVFHACANSKYKDNLTLPEFQRAMGTLNPKLSHFHLRNLFHELDSDGDGLLDLNEFLDGLGTVDDAEE